MTQIFVTQNIDMTTNPFKYGTIVQEPYFTDRKEELVTIKQALNSANHLILISPRRFGKTSLVLKAINSLDRPSIFINVQKAVSTVDLAALIVKETLKQYPLERIKSFIRNFRIIPTISINPITNGIDISFNSGVDSNVLLEDALGLLESVGTKDARLIAVFDEFQEILQLEKGIDKKLRAIMQEQSHVNYVFLGSQESMMTGIFEKVKSPFYHFGLLMYLKKITFNDFHEYIINGLSSVSKDADNLAKQILTISGCHPYYTQQLSATVWDLLKYKKLSHGENAVESALSQLIAVHDLDFERLWASFTKNERRILRDIATVRKLSSTDGYAASTTYSTASRLLKSGYLIKTDTYEIEDPFFKQWILTKLS